MANSRLEKVGTIYTRSRALLQSGAVKWADRPLWYEIFEAFPPKEEPRYDRPAPNLPLRTIFYEEDKVRARFHANNKFIGAVNFSSKKYKTLTQRFIEKYNQIKIKNEMKTEDEIYAEAIEILKSDATYKSNDSSQELPSFSTAFRDAQDKQKKSDLNVQVKDTFNTK